MIAGLLRRTDFQADNQMPAIAASANADNVPLTVTPHVECMFFHSAHTHNEENACVADSRNNITTSCR